MLIINIVINVLPLYDDIIINSSIHILPVLSSTVISILGILYIVHVLSPYLPSILFNTYLVLVGIIVVVVVYHY